MDYETCNEGLLELAELRVEMKALCTRLFPEPDPEAEPGSSQEPRPSTSADHPRPSASTSGDTSAGSLIVFTDPDSGSLNFLSLPLGSLIVFTDPDSRSLNFLSLPL